MRTLKFILAAWLKRSSKATRKAGGFTLIELLAAMVLAALVIAPLLGFLVNLMQTDRQEQAKTNSEQELQAAMDYITRDLQQAVYIYDQKGLAILTGGTDNGDGTASGGYATSTCPGSTPSAGCSQIPASDDQVPVLVFWKRKLLPKSLPPNGTIVCSSDPDKCNDAFVYSLVAYYLTKDTNQPPTWSTTAQIRRFEIQDAVKRPDGTAIDDTPGSTSVSRDRGFKLFDLGQSGDLTTKMNRWTKGDEAYEKKPEVLIDYVDQSTEDVSSSDGVPSEDCPEDTDPTGDTDPEWTKVPDYSLVASQFQTNSFYACVYSSKITARVFIRGNALARIREKNNPPTYSSQASAYFPRARIEVTGTGALRGE
jgi:prepilin-type N-terminal cleavage/methylation domain-containing protein